MTRPNEQRNRFGKHQRLGRSLDYQAVYDARTRQVAGPLIVYALPNGRPYSRLGLSVSRRVGNAVRRNRIKRLLREAFRLSQHDLPRGYDFVINVRPHDPAPLAEYQRAWSKASRKLHQVWSNRET